MATYTPDEDTHPDVQKVIKFIVDLPVLGREEIPRDEACPICLTSFESLMPTEDDSNPGHDPNLTPHRRAQGLTKLPGCGHIFCRKDVIDWIQTVHGSCPSCRNVFLDIAPPDSDDESDGGEYVPPPDGEDDDMLEIDTSTDYTTDGEYNTDGDVEADDVDVDMQLEFDARTSDAEGADTEDDWAWAEPSSDGLVDFANDAESATGESEGHVIDLTLATDDDEPVNEEPK